MSTPTPPESHRSPVVALVVEGDADGAVPALSRDDRLDVRRVPGPSEALAGLRDADCLVGGHALSSGSGLELRERVRARDETFPFVFYTAVPFGVVADAVTDDAWTDYVHESAGDCELADAVGRLADLRRGAAVATRGAGEADLPDAVAIVAPDGDIEAATDDYARRFGHDREDLRGRSWEELYPATEDDRLRSNALPSVEDGWQWTGRCVARRADGGRFRARTTLAGLGDGRIVVAIRDG